MRKDSLPAMDWPYFYERLSTIPELSEVSRRDGEAALGFMEKELGKGFLKTCGKNHPIYHKIMMAGGEGQLKEFVYWTQVLQKLKAGDSNYPNLLKKLLSAKNAHIEGIPFIDISARHLAHGFNVYFPKEKEDQKNPDLELTFFDTDEKVHIEVTRISEGAEREKQDRLYSKLLDVCLWYGYNLPNAGKLYKLVPDAQLPQLIGRIKALKVEAGTKKLAYYRDQYLSIAFAHPDCLGELDQWCSDLNIQRRFDGFNVKYDYTSRMIKTSRIRREAKQIADGQTGLIYCPVHVLFPLSMDVGKTVAAFTKELTKYRNIFGLVFYGEVIPPLSGPFTEAGEHYIYALRQNEAFVGRYTLMVKNPSFNLPLSKAARMGLINAAV